MDTMDTMDDINELIDFFSSLERGDMFYYDSSRHETKKEINLSVFISIERINKRGSSKTISIEEMYFNPLVPLEPPRSILFSYCPPWMKLHKV